MKCIVLFLFSMSLFFFVSAQDCQGYYYLTNNAEIVMTTYDKKDKENSKVTYKISNVKTAGNTVSASFHSEVTDDKGKSVSKGAGQYKCTGGVMYIDARVSLPAEQMQAYKDMEVQADEVYFEYPANMSAGQRLPDGDFKMTILNKGTVFSNIIFKQTERKVTGKENVTTPAGSWECWKITAEGQFKASIGNSGIGIPFNFNLTEWFAPGFGIVKTETATKNGKPAGYSLITSVKK